MDQLMTLELHYPANWAYEGEVDVLYSNGNGETSYGKLAQGQTMSRDTYPGHQWVVREAASRELLMSIVASRPAGGTAQPQLVMRPTRFGPPAASSPRPPRTKRCRVEAAAPVATVGAAGDASSSSGPVAKVHANM